MVDAKVIILAIVAFIVAVVIGVVLFYMGTHNALVNYDTSIEEAQGNLESQYQRRADLIPNLVTVVANSAKFEEKTYSEIAMLRSQAATGQQMMKDAKTPAQVEEASGVIENTLSRLMIVVEAYPQLKTTEAFMQLNNDIEGTENRVNYARTEYNSKVKDYRKFVQSIPSNFVAGMDGYTVDRWEMYKAAEGSEKAPVVPTINL